MFAKIRLSGVLVIALLLASCGDVTRETIEKWNGSKVGFQKMEEFIGDLKNDAELRLYALEILVRDGYGHKARGFLRDAPDREVLAEGFARRLLATFEGASELEKAVRIKDALLMNMILLPEATRVDVQKAIAAWAFAGIGPDSDAKAVQEHIEKRISISQIMDLGEAAADGAALLLSHGFGIDRLHKFLHDMGKPEIDARLLDAYRVLHKTPDMAIDLPQLEDIQALLTPDAIVYLLELYTNPALSESTRGDAFGLAIRAFREPQVKEKAERLLPGLFGVLKNARDDDRRLAAHYILRLGGVGRLAEVLATFKDDGAFALTNYDTPRFARDICRDDILKLRGDPMPVLLETLKGDNRVSRLLALTCVKLSQRFDLTDELEAWTKDTTDMADLVGEGVTLGQLAENATDALKAIASLARDRDEGRSSEDRFQALRALYENEMKLTGRELRRTVLDRYRAQKAK